MRLTARTRPSQDNPVAISARYSRRKLQSRLGSPLVRPQARAEQENLHVLTVDISTVAMAVIKRPKFGHCAYLLAFEYIGE